MLTFYTQKDPEKLTHSLQKHQRAVYDTINNSQYTIQKGETMPVITVSNHKGGCGKSTTCLFLIGGLYQRGKRVLLIDIDERATLSKKIANPQGATIADVLRGTPAARAVQMGKFCDIIPAAAELATPETIIKDRPGREYQIKKAIDGIKADYDFIIFDCPGSLNTLTINALTASDKVIIPTISDEDSIQGIYNMVDIIEDVQEYTNPGLSIAGVLLTGVNYNTVFGNAMLQNVENIAAERKIKMFQPIRQTVEIQAAKYNAADINIFDALKKNPARDELELFIDEFLKG